MVLQLQLRAGQAAALAMHRAASLQNARNGAAGHVRVIEEKLQSCGNRPKPWQNVRGRAVTVASAGTCAALPAPAWRAMSSLCTPPGRRQQLAHVARSARRDAVDADRRRRHDTPRPAKGPAQAASAAPTPCLPQGFLALELPLDAFVEPAAQINHRVHMAVDARKAQVQPQP